MVIGPRWLICVNPTWIVRRRVKGKFGSKSGFLHEFLGRAPSGSFPCPGPFPPPPFHFCDPVAATTNHPLTVHAVVRFRVMPIDLRSVKASVSMECGSSSRVFFKKPSLIFAPRNGFDDEPSFIKPRQVSAVYNNNQISPYCCGCCSAVYPRRRARRALALQPTTQTSRAPTALGPNASLETLHPSGRRQPG